LAHPDRVAWAQKTADLMTVRDAVMRREYKTGSLPATLDSLVPHYLRDSQVRRDDAKPLYIYDPEGRILTTAEGMRVRGLLTRHMPPASLSFPPPEPVPLGLTTAAETNRAPRGSALVVPGGPDLPPPPDGAFVFEAEHWSEMNYGWEIERNPTVGGGACINCKEGTTTGSSQCFLNTFDFYNVREKMEDQTVLKYRFHLPRAGRYYLLGRMLATCSHCSNSINVGLDRGGLKLHSYDKEYYGGFMGAHIPFRWMWATARIGAVYLQAGDHYVHVFPHEDGLLVDQFMLWPADRGAGFPSSEAYAENLAPNRGTSFERADGPPQHLSFELASMVIGEDSPAACSVVLRRLRPGQGAADLRVVLREAGEDGADLALGRYRLDMATLPELAFVPIDFSALDYARLPRREFLLEATLEGAGGPIASRHLPLMHPFLWEVSQDFPYLPNNQAGPLDGDAEPAGDTPAWRPFAYSNWTPLGVMDFGVLTAGNSLHAPEFRTIYVRTVISAPETADYMLKAQSDDQMLLWLDGRLVARIDTMQSVIRNSYRFRIRIEKGVHRVRMRVNQGAQVRKLQGGYWQASLRFRTPEDDLSGVIGAPSTP
jgi:hypothetical protein